MLNVIRLINTFEMHATIVKNKITQRDNYKGIMSVIVVVLLLTLTLIAIFSAIDQLGLYKLTDLQQKDNLAAANPQVVKEMQGVVREFIDNSQPPLSEVNQEKFNNIKKALSKAK